MDGDILTTAECAERLKITERTVRQMVSDGRVPCFRVGGEERGHLRFNWPAVLNALESAGPEDEGSKGDD